jgi:DNA-binding PadR family transcriptional regulator
MAEIGRVTTTKLAVLRALEAPTAQRHGFAIAQNAHRKPGSVYPVLDQLEKARWVTAEWVDSPFEGRPRRRVYTFTDYGAREAARLLAERGVRAGEVAVGALPKARRQPTGRPAWNGSEPAG